MNSQIHEKSRWRPLTRSVRRTIIDRLPASLEMALASAMVAALSGCVTTPAPLKQEKVAINALAQARAKIRNGLPAFELQTAGSKLERAQRALERKEYQRARQLLDEVQVDAEVARLTALMGAAEALSMQHPQTLPMCSRLLDEHAQVRSHAAN